MESFGNALRSKRRNSVPGCRLS
uniref:Uncharacterized protein n=1 Tax=Romanomermis culicivorax TaxID=13658 RepID=A0A915HKK8_ROMCU